MAMTETEIGDRAERNILGRETHAARGHGIGRVSVRA